MDPDFLYRLYEWAVLPQFSVPDGEVVWTEHRRIGPDETASFLKIDGFRYVLIFEDYDGFGRNDGYLRETVVGAGEDYQFVPPLSATNVAPSYNGFKLPVPCRYAEGLTGTFTLINPYRKLEE